MALQIWSMTAFTDVSIESYSSIKILSVLIGVFSIGPTIVSLEKFMNEHAAGTLQTIQKNMEQQKEISNQLMTELEQNAFMPFEQQENDKNDKNDNNGNIQNDPDIDDIDGFDLDGVMEI